MQIGELAERTGVSRRMLRHYERYGLLHAGRAANGWRDYDEVAVERVGLIADMIGGGLTLDGVKQLSACLDVHAPSDCAGVELALRTYQARLDVIEQRLTRLRTHHDQLTQHVEWLRRRRQPSTSAGSE